MTTIIEFNDLELSLYRGGERLYQAPGFAMVREGELLFGEAALRLARMHPQQANQQYLSRMNADPLLQPVRAAANHADLVYLHLKELAGFCREDTVLAVPGTMTGEQLGVLLGICQEAGLTVSGFVNAAVAAVSTTAVPERITYLDVFLQHIQVSELRVGEEVRHERSLEVRDCGFSSLLDGWVNIIADRFVQETRFDPLHTADTEQQLYDQVYDWARGAHQRSEVSVEVVHGQQQRRVELSRSQLEQKAQQRIDRLIDALPDCPALVLTARAALLPGLSSRLKSAGFQLVLLAADAAARGSADHMDQVRTVDSELRLVGRLPHGHPTTADEGSAAPVPTHLLSGATARPLSSPTLGMALRETADGVWLVAAAGLTVNGRPLEADRRLVTGDVIANGNRTFTAIRLED